MKRLIKKLILCGASAMVMLTQTALAVCPSATHNPASCICCNKPEAPKTICCEQESEEKLDCHIQQTTEDDCHCFSPKQNEPMPDATMAPGSISLVILAILPQEPTAVAESVSFTDKVRFASLKSHPATGPPGRLGDSRAPPATAGQIG